MVKQVLDAQENDEIQTGDLTIIRDFVDVRDVVRAYWMILENGEPGSVYNICSGEGRVLRDVVLKIIERSGKQIKIIKNPDRVRPADNQAIIGSYDKIYNELGWKPQIHFDQSLQDVMNERS
jgi:GDP-4-dehydro-6-deoxy-D-mannose reductase